MKKKYQILSMALLLSDSLFAHSNISNAHMAVIMAGIRVATVANIAMVSVGALIGVPSLGTLFTDGLARNIPSEILAGVILSLLLALVLDLLLILLTRALTPWQAATVANRRSPERKA